MAPPSKVAIATGSVLRLVKEEASYHKEIAQQEERIKKLESSEGDENKEYTLRQEVVGRSNLLEAKANSDRRSKPSQRPGTCCLACRPRSMQL
jgi:flagellar motility protein MotE (MotC chaperone)